ncbi:MAG: hypothetical protein QOE91_1230 [Gaiellaceae bacterium]|nr:hypothetical protein [Gaiellaceae bacterium]
MVELVLALALFVGPLPPSGPTIAWGGASHAWAGGGAGILASSDGGATWRTQTRDPALQLAATDARHAWALSAQGVTIRTTDGVHWRSLGVQHLLRLSFVDATHGFALERNDVVVRTTDGGVTWTPTGGPTRLQSVCFSTATTGWAARNGTVWRTRDAGAHWTAKLLLRAPDGNAPVPDLSCHGNDVWVMITTGAAAGSQAYAVYRSRDAGATWRAEYAQFLLKGLPRISAYAGPISALGRGSAVVEGSCAACGGYGTVTVIHGAIRKTFSDAWPGPVAFESPRLGLLVTQSARTQLPSVWRTVDGGRRWTRVLTSTRLKP